MVAVRRTIAFWAILVASVHAALDPLRYVDLLVGSANGGNVFAGASLPYGMAKASADTNSSSNQGGFTLDGSPVTGFSVMHDSGTGGAPSLGNFPIFAYESCPDDDVNQCVFPKRDRAGFGYFNPQSVRAVPGFFGINITGGPRVEMTTSEHAALFRFTFNPGSGKKPLVLQDLSDLSDSRQNNGSVTVDGSRIKGDAVFLPSFGQGQYKLYFCSDFSGPNGPAQIADSGIFVNTRASAEVKELTISRSINGYPLPGGAFMRFASGTQTIYVRTGVSLISTDQACSNGEREIPSPADFDQYTKAATDAWRLKLSPIVVETKDADPSFITNFYSGLYRTMISPQNYTGENPLFDKGEPYFDSFYCIWDLFRTTLPFLTIVDPAALTQMVRSLISTYDYEGWLPDCRMSLNKGYTQGGSNADNVLADAFVKGVKGGIDWKKAYEAVKKDAEVEPFDWCCQGRGGLDSWAEVGYVPAQDFDYKGFGTLTRSISRTLEYAYNDYAISEMAAGLGKKGDQEKYLKSSGNWRNLFKEDVPSSFSNGTDTGFSGFFQPRYLNRTWGFQNPLLCSNIEQGASCSLQANGPETFESSIWEYGFFTPHSMSTLVTYYGGPQEFVRRLDFLHDAGINYIGNEPAFLTVFQYHYAGRPGLSAKRVHTYIPQFFAPTPPGLPGNDDSGTMDAFLCFAMMGLFPCAGQNVYYITPPFFESVRTKSPLTGKTAVIRNENFDPSYQRIYIQSATLNGEPYTKNWIDHSFFVEGKELVLTLGERESEVWGTRPEDLPPSITF